MKKTKIKFAHIALLLLIFVSNMFFEVFPHSSTNAEITFPESIVNAVGGEWSKHAATSFDGGSGRLNDPYQIANASQLALLANIFNYGYTVNGRNYEYLSEAYYELTSDIDLKKDNGYIWYPIGWLNSNTFTASFNGNNHTIKNMDKAPLFGNVVGASIQNVCVEYDISKDSGSEAVGGIVTNVYGGLVTIINCFVKGRIAYKSGKGCKFGGLVGQAYSDSSNPTTLSIYQCGNLATININSGSGIAGGIIGYIGWDVRAVFMNCFNQGTINSWAGGIIGHNDENANTTMTNCYNSFEVTNGIVAKNNSSITATRCFSLNKTDVGTVINNDQLLGKTKIGDYYLVEWLNMTN